MSSRSSGGTAPGTPDWTADPLIGKVIDGRYRIEDVLGTGGVGVVYRAEHLKLQRQVAIKVLHEKLGLIDELRRRFEREGQALSALSHPNVVSVNDYGISENMPYLVMELLEGRTLADLIDDDGPPAIEVALDIERQILRGLAFAHANGIVHRDLKAANVFLQVLPDAPHHVKLLDFGLAKIFTTDEGSDDSTLTKSGTILGTPAYMSPEQATGSAVDERADVYSAGVLLFEMLTGRYPFEAPTRADMLRAHMLEPVPDPESVRAGLQLTPQLKKLVVKSMAKDRRERFANATQMLDAVETLPRPAATFDPHSASGQVPVASTRVPSERAEESTVAASSGTGRSASARRRARASSVRRPLLAMGVAMIGGLLLAAAVALVVSPGTDAPGPVTSVGPGAETTSGQGVDEAAPEDVAPEPTEREGEVVDPGELAAPEEMEAGAPEETEVVAPGEPGAEAPPSDRPAARDPFRDPLPAALRPFHRRVRQGRPLNVRDRREVMRLQRDMPTDPRPTLVLAHHFVDVTFYRDALERYVQAYAMDPSCRGDRRMMSDLIRMSSSPGVSDRAQDLLVQVYGAEAIPAVDRAIGESDEPIRIALLTRLRSRL